MINKANFIQNEVGRIQIVRSPNNRPPYYQQIRSL
jgi:hypothetical protein